MANLIQSFVMNIVKNNPEMQKRINTNNTMKNYFDILRSGDSARGEKLASQILETYGLTREEGVSQAKEALNQMFGFGQNN